MEKKKKKKQKNKQKKQKNKTTKEINMCQKGVSGGRSKKTLSTSYRGDNHWFKKQKQKKIIISPLLPF